MGLIIKFILGLSLGVVSTASLKAQSEMVSLRTNPEAAAKVPETEVKKIQLRPEKLPMVIRKNLAYKYADEGENAEVFEVYDLKNKALLYYEIVYIESAGERRYVKYRLDGEALPNVSK